MRIEEIYLQTINTLSKIYDEGEASQIANLVLENITGLNRITRVIQKEKELSKDEIEIIESYVSSLLVFKPIQYVIKEAWFAGLKLYVDESVLIPRPETEELVHWIKKEFPFNIQIDNFNILDIGTGSGCVAISLKKHFAFADVQAIDISNNALKVAHKNASINNTLINFKELDILNRNDWSQLQEYDIIVSNPPYIKKSEALDMSKNVLDYEPHAALFVPDKNALMFYVAISEFAKNSLKQNGKIYFEINESHAKEVFQIMEAYGFNNIELKKDLYGKDRMIKGEKKF